MKQWFTRFISQFKRNWKVSPWSTSDRELTDQTRPDRSDETSYAGTREGLNYRGIKLERALPEGR